MSAAEVSTLVHKHNRNYLSTNLIFGLVLLVQVLAPLTAVTTLLEAKPSYPLPLRRAGATKVFGRGIHYSPVESNSVAFGDILRRIFTEWHTTLHFHKEHQITNYQIPTAIIEY